MPGSEALDIDQLLSALSNFREFGAVGKANFYDAKEEVFQFAQGKDLERFLNVADNITDAVQALVDANGGKDLPPDINPENNQKDKADTIYRTIFNRYGNKNDHPWPSGGSQTVSETKDTSINGKRVVIKNVYKSNNHEVFFMWDHSNINNCSL